jgi:hypothetical protein
LLPGIESVSSWQNPKMRPWAVSIVRWLSRANRFTPALLMGLMSFDQPLSLEVLKNRCPIWV